MSEIEKFYITTAIDYPNSKPHLGHAYEKIFADVIARWNRIKGKDVWFLIGTDEHGQKIARAAENAGKAPQAFVDEMAEHFKELFKKLRISNDDFIRTTEKRHEEAAKLIFQKVFDKGDIYKSEYEGQYCVSCERFYTEKELEDGKCPVHKKELETLKEESYFFKMGKYKQQIMDYIKNNNFILPEFRKNEILNRLDEDLLDLSVSRKTLKWGIPLPNDDTHVMYVWFDALSNYVTALNYPEGEKYKKYWPADVHIIGKDINWFHTVIWPAILLAADIPLPKTVYVHGFITIGGEKLSKSRGIVVDPYELVERYGVDPVRYFLIREIPSGEDGNFSEEALINRINSELADTLGNLVSRVLAFVEQRFDGKVPERGEKDELIEIAIKAAESADKSMENYMLHIAMNDIWFLISEANKYINEKKPWEVKDKEELGGIVYNLLETLRIISILLHPFVPETAEKIAEQLGTEKKFLFKDIKFGLLKPGTKVKKGKILFEKIK